MEKTIGKYKVETIHDTEPFDPRDDDNLGTMICFHNRYVLGDKHDYLSSDYDGWEEMESDIIKKENVAVILPLYLYNHSGITIATTPFSCPWDSGQVGFIIISKEKVRHEFSMKRISKQMLGKIKGYLESEVKLYDQYLIGDAFGYRITDTETDVEVDSCWGYFGEDHCMEEAESITKHIIAYENKELVE